MNTPAIEQNTKAHPPPLTASEKEIWNQLSRGGDNIILRNGWPDFLVLHKATRAVYAVEVKSMKDGISRQQRKVHEILRTAGVETFVVYAELPHTWNIPGEAFIEAKAKQKQPPPTPEAIVDLLSSANSQKGAEISGPRHAISFEELCKRIPMSDRTIRGLMRAKLIPYIQMPKSRRILFFWDDVERSMKRFTRGGIGRDD